MGLRWALKQERLVKAEMGGWAGRPLEAGLTFALTQGWALGKLRERREPRS